MSHFGKLLIEQLKAYLKKDGNAVVFKDGLCLLSREEINNSGLVFRKGEICDSYRVTMGKK